MSATVKTLNLFEELRQARVIFQKNMISARQCNESSSRYPRCDFTAQFDRDHDVIPYMYDQGRRSDPRQKRSTPTPKRAIVASPGYSTRATAWVASCARAWITGLQG